MTKRMKPRPPGDDSGPLTDSPFAALDGLAVPLRAKEDPPPPEDKVADRPAYRIERTRKGGWPVSVERRPGGKVVTIIRSCSGDLSALLRVLKKHCAAGGVAREDSIELQGDHRAKVEAFLSASPKT
jgi:translation initiation factor 1